MTLKGFAAPWCRRLWANCWVGLFDSIHIKGMRSMTLLSLGRCSLLNGLMWVWLSAQAQLVWHAITDVSLLIGLETFAPKKWLVRHGGARVAVPSQQTLQDRHGAQPAQQGSSSLRSSGEVLSEDSYSPKYHVWWHKKIQQYINMAMDQYLYIPFLGDEHP
jgi:hypothetical protein